jgi:mRNA interferase RelE/StbE
LKTAFIASFAKDLEKVRAQHLKNAVRETIEQVERAENLQTLTNVKKLQGSDNYYRIRVRDYRPGVTVENDRVTFVRFLHRKEIYRYFP